jgi:hypothetical protein
MISIRVYFSTKVGLALAWSLGAWIYGPVFPPATREAIGLLQPSAEHQTNNAAGADSAFGLASGIGTAASAPVARPRWLRQR